MRRADTALAARACGETLCTPEFMHETLKQVWKCEMCEEETRLIPDLLAFSDRFAAEIEWVISTVSASTKQGFNIRSSWTRNSRRMSETRDK